jgi:hypothetical protein
MVDQLLETLEGSSFWSSEPFRKTLDELIAACDLWGPPTINTNIDDIVGIVGPISSSDTYAHI